jgi:hypothetical protein
LDGLSAGDTIRVWAASKVHACEIRACEGCMPIRDDDMRACKMHACEMHACEMHACEMHACEIYIYGIETYKT